MIPKRIVVLGGSTVYGQGDPEAGGFVAQLRAWHEPKKIEANRVFNLGVGGDALMEMLERGPREIKVRRPDLIIIYPGLNDIRRLASIDAPCQTSLNVFEERLRSLLEELKPVAPAVLMSAVPPDESRTSPFWGKWFFTRADAHEVTFVVRGTAETTRTPYLPLFERWQNRPDLYALLADGLHCNQMGHRALFEEVKTFLTGLFDDSCDITNEGNAS